MFVMSLASLDISSFSIDRPKSHIKSYLKKSTLIIRILFISIVFVSIYVSGNKRSYALI